MTTIKNDKKQFHPKARVKFRLLPSCNIRQYVKVTEGKKCLGWRQVDEAVLRDPRMQEINDILDATQRCFAFLHACAAPSHEHWQPSDAADDAEFWANRDALVAEMNKGGTGFQRAKDLRVIEDTLAEINAAKAPDTVEGILLRFEGRKKAIELLNTQRRAAEASIKAFHDFNARYGRVWQIMLRAESYAELFEPSF